MKEIKMRYIKFFISMLFVVVLYGCSNGSDTSDMTERFSLPKELEGYKIYKLVASYDSSNNNSSVTLYVVVPPKTETSTTEKTVKEKPVMLFEHHNKGPNIAVIVEGKKYKLAEEKEVEKLEKE